MWPCASTSMQAYRCCLRDGVCCSSFSSHSVHKLSACTSKVIDKAPVRWRSGGDGTGCRGGRGAPATSRARLLRKLGLAPRGGGRAAPHAVVIRAPPRRLAHAPPPPQARLHGSASRQPGFGRAAELGGAPGALPAGATAKRKAPELLGASGLEAVAQCVRRAPHAMGPGLPKGSPHTMPAKVMAGGERGASVRSPMSAASKAPLASLSKRGGVRSVAGSAPSTVADSLFYRSSPGAVELASKLARATQQGGQRNPVLSDRRPEHRTAVVATLVPEDIQW